MGQSVFSLVQTQDGAQDATFKTVRCERLVVGFEGVTAHNRTGKLVASPVMCDLDAFVTNFDQSLFLS